MPEIINKRSSAGVLIPPGDVKSLSSAIVKLINDNEYRRTLSVNAHAVGSEHFAISKQVENIVNIYRELG
jgi:glycosyltransferase involved in cell wall biosynthesis